MKKMIFLLSIPLILFVFIAGCSTDQNPVNADLRASMAPIILPAGATLTSATFNVSIPIGNSQNVNVHRITSDWDEMTVTWNSFGSSFDAAVEGSFTATPGWKAVDVTSLVNGWINGTFDNFGLLLDQGEVNYPRAQYYSREAPINHAFLEVCYELNGVVSCIQTEVIADTYIHETTPDANKGLSNILYTGWENENDLEKQALFIFELEAEPQGGCSHTIGYWKNHAGFGPQADVVSQYLPIWLGNDNGLSSMPVVDAQMAVDILKMKTYGAPKNGITKLLAQLLGSKLSIASGAADADIADAIAAADAFLSTHAWTDWTNLSKDEKNHVLNLMSTFDQYNNGYIGPGHCDEFNSDHDYEYEDGGKEKKN